MWAGRYIINLHFSKDQLPGKIAVFNNLFAIFIGAFCFKQSVIGISAVVHRDIAGIIPYSKKLYIISSIIKVIHITGAQACSPGSAGAFCIQYPV